MKIFTWKQRLLVLTLTLISVAFFATIGYFAGKKLGSIPAGIMIAVLVSYPFTQWLLVNRITSMYNKEKHE